MHRVVVLGAGYAGLPAVNRIARQTYRDEVELVLISNHDQFVERPRLHQLATGQPRPELPLRKFLKPGVDLRVGHVDRLDAAQRTLHFGRTDQPWSLQYDTLLYAPGSTIDLSAPGVAAHAHSVATPESARLVSSLLSQDPKARIVVCGGGLTGLELAAEVAESYPSSDVSIVTRGELAGWLSPRARDYVRKSMAALGVHVQDDTSVTRVESGNVATSRGDTPFDLCLWAGGFVVPQLAAQGGIQVDRNGRVVTDLSMRSVSDEAVYALGDAAAVSGPWGDSLAYGCRTGGFTAPTAADAVVARLTGRPAPRLKFRYIHECLSLGRRHHVIQFLDKDGAVRARTLRGRKARMYKDLVLDSGRWTVKHAGPYGPVRRRHIVPAGTTSGTAESLRRSAS